MMDDHAPLRRSLYAIMIVVATGMMLAQVARVHSPDAKSPTPFQSGNDRSRWATIRSLGDDGTYAINTQPVPKAQLETQIRTIFAPRNAKLMFIKAGQNRVYQDVVDAMDVARSAGVQIIGFTPIEAYHK